MKSIISTFLFLTNFVFLFGQGDCSFSIKNDTTICGPAEIEIWVAGGNLGKVNWRGNSLTSDDTLKIITANISKTSTYYVSNRIVDPLNLVTNGGFEAGNQDFSSSYWASCMNGAMPQGSYCIGKRTDTYWPAWNSCSDRKDPGNGNMFITDGAILTDEEIWCQTVAVETNTNYALSAWVTPVLDLNNAVLQFTINNDTIGAPFSAKPTECEWNEFFEIWNSELNTSAEICITNENKASNGNDFALDDIALNKVCYKQDSIKVIVIDSVKFNLNNDTIICPGDPIFLSPDTLYSDNYSYLWSNGETTESIIVSDPNDYSLKITHFSGCFGENKIQIKKLNDPISELFNDTTVCLSIKGGLTLNPGQAKLSIWNKPSGEIDSNNIIIATEPGIYDITLFNGINCFTSDRIEIKEFCATELFIPNTFTPNGDDNNDTFGAEAIETYSFDLKIFNRYGKIVFESFNINERWNGNGAPQGTYLFRLEYEQISKESGDLKNYSKIGVVNLIR